VTSTPIPAGVLTVDDEPGAYNCYPVRFGETPIATLSAAERARLLSSPRPDGVPDDLRELVNDWWANADAMGGNMGAVKRACATQLAAVLGVPVPPYQPTPPEPEPAETLAECMKAITEAERRAWNQSACGPIAAPVSEVRTGPHNRGEGLTRLIAKVQLGLGNLSDYERATVVEAREFVARWDAEDAAPEPETITVERDDLAAVLSDIDEWMQYVTPDAEMKDSVLRLRAAAGLSVPSEGGES
jgi:hypothetical protein